MAVLYPVVGSTSDLLLLGIAEIPHRRPVRSQAVGNDRVGSVVASRAQDGA